MASTIEPELVFSRRAYAKIMLHAAKYPHCALNGLLLVPKAQLKKLSGSSEAPATLEVVDAIPLFHQTHGLSPMLEMALGLTESLAEESGLAIGGLYHANELFDSTSVDSFTQELANKIAESLPFSLLVTLDNKRLGLVMESHALIVQQNIGGKWRPRTQGSLVLEESTLEVSGDLLQRKIHRQLADFDNHLDELECDFFNPEINEEIDSF
eukprot:snap_masked-scaffold836_size90567-processed-gene-0.11 protein:Tk11228 transcript:snap_masked-scaffold836_size90567-processed-gene-0.11-mRNA-1 annotation:"er membrane protein complex subunit 8 9 homolog"